MKLLDLAGDLYNSCKQTITGETDITCPNCGKSKLYMMDGVINKTAFCPECNFNLEEEIRKNNKDGGGSCPPSSGMLMY